MCLYRKLRRTVAGSAPGPDIMQKSKNQRGASRQNANQSKRNNARSKSQKDARSERRQEARSDFSRPEAAPVAQAAKFRNKNPVISYEKDGSSCRIRHTERIGTVNGSVAFAATGYAINPGLPSSFPFLSGIANRFESYRFDRLVYKFKTKTATSAVGDVIQVIDYDASDGAPTNSIQAEAYQGAVSSAPWQDNSNVSSKQNLHKLPSRYVRGESVPANTDVKLYDVGNYYICTENQASTALVGYLYVEYDVLLMTPQLRASDFGIAGGAITGASSMSGANPFGTAPAADAQARGISMSAASVLTVTSPGYYLLTWQVTGTTVTALNASAGSGGTLAALTTEMSNAANTVRVVTVSLLATVPNVTVTFTATAAAVSACTLDVGVAPESSFALAALMNDPDPAVRSDYRVCAHHKPVFEKLVHCGRLDLLKDFVKKCPECTGCSK